MADSYDSSIFTFWMTFCVIFHSSWTNLYTYEQHIRLLSVSLLALVIIIVVIIVNVIGFLTVMKCLIYFLIIFYILFESVG